MSEGITVQNNTESRSYDAIVDDKVIGMIIYERRGDRIMFHHTIVEPDFRRRGIATTLVRGALDDLRAQGETLTNYCGFVSDFITANPRYADLVDHEQPGRVLPYAKRREDARLGSSAS